MALDTLKTSMTIEVKGMFKEFLDGLKLSTASLEVVDPTIKVTDANSDKGEANSEKSPSTSGRNGTGTDKGEQITIEQLIEKRIIMR